MAGLGILFLSVSVYAYALYWHERLNLRETVTAVLGEERGDKEAILTKLTEWVYYNQGFAKNRHYFIAPAFGPTATQVLQHGGDCSDKSRLLSAMLYEVGIDNTLVMLYSTFDMTPTHTVVETRSGDFRAVADPVFNIIFPGADGHLLGVRELRSSKTLLEERLDELVRLRGWHDKIIGYKRATETYEIPKTINWDKNAILQTVEKLISTWHDDPYLVARPRILENPFLLISITSFSLSGLTLGLAGWLHYQRRHGKPDI